MTSIIFQWKTTSTLSGASVCKITFKHIPCLALNPGSPILTHDLVVDKSMTMVVGNRAWADGPADGKRRERSQQCREGDNNDTCTCLYRQGGSELTLIQKEFFSCEAIGYWRIARMHLCQCNQVNVSRWVHPSECTQMNVLKWMHPSEYTKVNATKWMNPIECT